MNPYSPDSLTGRLLGDRQRYRLDLRLGEGGMGYVFLAMDTLLGQQVALKLLKETLVGSGELRKRFEREVALCAALKSNHIVQVTDYGVTAEGHPFYVMEYLQGQTLGQLLRREKRLSIKQSAGIISQVCEGLYLAHTGVSLWRDGATTSEHVQVVHRDLKPDNIFLVPTVLGELVKILDFGIAKIREDSAEYTNLTNMFLGTYHYAAPEQLAAANDLDGRADIYSLGIIFYEMLSGTDPFGLGLNVNKIDSISWALAHTSKLPVSLRLQPGCEHLPLALEAVVMRCLQKAPNQRFASVDELNRALQAAVAVQSEPSAAAHPQRYQQNDNTPHSKLDQETISPEVVRDTPQMLDGASSDFVNTQRTDAAGSGCFEQAQEYKQNLQQYERSFAVAIHQQYPLTQDTLQDLQQLQQSLNLKKNVIDAIEAKVVQKYDVHSHEVRGGPVVARQGISDPPNITIRASENKRRVQRPLLKAILFVAVVSVSLACYTYIQWQHQSAKVSLRSIKNLQDRKDYDEKLIFQAKELAKNNNFQDAIAEASRIQVDSSLHASAQLLINLWSANLLKQAQEQYKQSYNFEDLEDAITTTKAISKTSSAARDAQEAPKQWRIEWKNNEAYLQAARKALNAGQGHEAIKKANQVKLLGQEVKRNTSYWQNKVKPIVERAEKLISVRQKTTYSIPPQVKQQAPPTRRYVSPRRVKQQAPPTRRYVSSQVKQQAPATKRRVSPQSQAPRSQTPQSDWTMKRL